MSVSAKPGGSQSKAPSQGNMSKFIFGGLSGMGATLVVQPVDLIKNRMQLSGEMGRAREHKTFLHALFNIARKEGVRSLYTGLSAGLLRQATYTTTRLGTFNTLNDYFAHGTTTAFHTKVLIGVTAGAIGSFVGTPADLALIRMTSDGRLPPEQRRNYKNVFNALVRIVREEGVFALWRGCYPTVARAMILNAAQLGTYQQAKEYLVRDLKMKDGLGLHFAASMASGLVATLASLPVDITKTRVQTMKIVNGVPEYKGSIDCLVKTVRAEGFFSLWKGFMPYYLRLGPHTVLTFIILEQMNLAYKNFYLN